MEVRMRSVLSFAIVAAFGASVAAQAPAMKPGPEHKRLGYFAGQWNYEGNAKASPFGPAGKIAGSETCEWFAGGFQLVCRSKGSGPKGPGTGQSIMAFDPGRKSYTFYAISSHGDSIFVRGSVDGKVWTWFDEMTMEGKPVKIQATITEETPTSYSFKLEASSGGGPMTVIEEGTATKVKST
jgi:hypothetical protein